MKTAALEARSIVEAHLNRPPQDALEAVVVLEAWNGSDSDTAFSFRDSLVGSARAVDVGVSVGATGLEDLSEAWRDAVAILVAVLATTLVAGPLAHEVGPDASDAWRLALPWTFGLSHGLRKRYLGADDRLGGMRADAPGVAAGVGLAIAPLLLLGVAGLLAAVTVVVWLASVVVVWRLWLLPLAGVVAAACAAGALTGDDLAGVAVFGFLMLCASVAAVAASPPEKVRPSAWPATLQGAATGTGLGLILAVDADLAWPVGASTIVLLLVLPVPVATVWAGMYLSRMWLQLQRALAGHEPPAADAAARRVVLVFLSGACGRVAVGVVATAAMLATVESGPSDPVLKTSLLFCAVSLLGLVAGMVDSVGRSGLATGGILFGAIVAIAVSVGGVAVPGGAVVAGCVAAVHLLLFVVAELVASPVEVLARS